MENVEANALGFARFVQQPIALGLFQRGGNCILVQSFQFAHVFAKVKKVERVESQTLASALTM